MFTKLTTHCQWCWCCVGVCVLVLVFGFATRSAFSLNIQDRFNVEAAFMTYNDDVFKNNVVEWYKIFGKYGVRSSLMTFFLICFRIFLNLF
jgi:hypothetical protein